FPLPRELRPQTRDWIIEPISLQFLFGPVTRRIGHGVTTITIRANFEEGRMRLFANGIHNLRDFVAHFAKVHSVENFSGNVVTLGPIDNLFERCRSFHRGAHGKEVVFADENDRQLKERSQIQSFMKRALVDRAVTEKAEGHAIFAPVLNGKRQSNSKWNVGADNGVPAVHVSLTVKEMHRTAQASRTAGFL